MKKLMCLTMIFGLFLLATSDASAQASSSKSGKPVVCSKDDTVEAEEAYDVTIVNNTSKPIILYWVDSECREHINTDFKAEPGGTIKFTNMGIASAYRVREAGTDNLLEDFLITPENRSINITGASPGVDSVAEEIRGKMIGTWLQPGSQMIIDADKFTVYEKGKVLISSSYSLSDDMLEFTGTDGNQSQRKVSFKNNNKIMVWVNIAKNKSAEFTRVLKSAQPVRKPKK